mmetsp:Transcript_18355/g.55385  ORF Transcript_18355/g.55385 Transcript_18355/m.55385 type:complete len:208 (-) Transcript_18355:380-1003(-)
MGTRQLVVLPRATLVSTSSKSYGSLERPSSTDSSLLRISESSSSAFLTTAGGALPAKPGEASRAASFSMSASSFACCLPSRARSLSASTSAARGRSASSPSCTTRRAAAPSAASSAAVVAAARSDAASIVSIEGSTRASVAIASASALSMGARVSEAITVAAIFLAGLTLYSARALRTERTSAWMEANPVSASRSRTRGPSSAMSGQ